ncbi:CHASE3 domain-containing protein, partial [Pedobacter sp.]|uniref:CHASE3 domain-containing protein n=1 Tax=Pedobacter sp. TaxID=1411316 RepID=UPI003D7F767B
MQKTLKKNLRVGLGLSLIVLFISSLASYVSISNLIRSSSLVAESNEVLSTLDSVISNVKDAETGQRGYLLTGCGNVSRIPSGFSNNLIVD